MLLVTYLETSFNSAVRNDSEQSERRDYDDNLLVCLAGIRKEGILCVKRFN
jgi:hypothetical protein